MSINDLSFGHLSCAEFKKQLVKIVDELDLITLQVRLVRTKNEADFLPNDIRRTTYSKLEPILSFSKISLYHIHNDLLDDNYWAKMYRNNDDLDDEIRKIALLSYYKVAKNAFVISLFASLEHMLRAVFKERNEKKYEKIKNIVPLCEQFLKEFGVLEFGPLRRGAEIHENQNAIEFIKLLSLLRNLQHNTGVYAPLRSGEPPQKIIHCGREYDFIEGVVPQYGGWFDNCRYMEDALVFIDTLIDATLRLDMKKQILDPTYKEMATTP